jgi:DNA polymerase IIIc chi subunit
MDREVIFIILTLANKQRTLCDLTEKLYTSGKRIILFCDSEQLAVELDRMLWVWKQSSFIPHILLDELNASLEEPVVITKSVVTNEDYDVLIQAAPASDDIRNQFTLAIDFAEKYDTNALARSRERYRKLQQENIKLKSMQAGEFMHAPV